MNAGLERRPLSRSLNRSRLTEFGVIDGVANHPRWEASSHLLSKENIIMFRLGRRMEVKGQGIPGSPL